MQHGAEGASQRTPSSPTVRFVLLTDQPRRLNRASTAPEPRRVSWVLVAANNRALGRAPGLFGSVKSCLADTTALIQQLERAGSSVTFHDGGQAGTSHWAWTVHLDEQPRAVAAFRYQRRLECENSLRRFLTAVRAASPVAPTVFRLGSRLAAQLT